MGHDEFENLTSDFARTHSFKKNSRFNIGDDFPAWFENAIMSEPGKAHSVGIFALLKFELCIHHVEISCRTPQFSADKLTQWMEVDSNLSAQLAQGLLVLETNYDIEPILKEKVFIPANNIYLIGISATEKAHYIKLNRDEYGEGIKLNRPQTYLEWIKSIPAGSLLSDPGRLFELLQKFISAGWLETTEINL